MATLYVQAILKHMIVFVCTVLNSPTISIIVLWHILLSVWFQTVTKLIAAFTHPISIHHSQEYKFVCMCVCVCVWEWVLGFDTEIGFQLCISSEDSVNH